MRSLKKLLAAATIATLALTGSASAEDWAPDGPLTVQIGFGPGGTTDTMGRVLVAQMKEQTGWNIIAENVTGGGGVAMFTGIARRPASNDVVGLGVNMPILINLVRRGTELGFDIDSFNYVGTLAGGQNAIVARADAPYATLEEFIAYAADNPGVAMGFDAPPQRALMAAVMKAAGVEINMVTMESSADAVRLLLGKQVAAAFSAGTHLPYLETGELNVLGTSNKNRLSYAPDAKSFVDLGYDFYLDPYYYLAMHKDTDPAALAAISAAFDAALKTPEVTEIIQNVNQTAPLNLGPDGTKQMMVDGLAVSQSLFGG